MCWNWIHTSKGKLNTPSKSGESWVSARREGTMSSLKVTDIECKTLPNLEKRGKSDPFVELEYLGESFLFFKLLQFQFSL